jgi:AraC family transcriptional activator of pobA
MSSGRDFSVQRMEAIYERQGEAPDPPHRHDYYTVIWSTEASGSHTVDFKTYPLEPRQVFFVSPGQIHQVITPTRPKGIVITFSPEFLSRNNISSRFISDLYLFQDYGDAPPLKLDEEASAQLGGFLEQMLLFIDRPIRFRSEALGALLRLFLICCYEHCDIEHRGGESSGEAGVSLLRNFRDQLESAYMREHQVAWYAEQALVSPDHLNRTVKHLTGKTVKEHIQERIILEARRQLLYSEQSVKEIAFGLGFDEATHFSAFFKRGTGMRPMSYRKQERG